MVSIPTLAHPDHLLAHHPALTTPRRALSLPRRRLLAPWPCSLRSLSARAAAACSSRGPARSCGCNGRWELCSACPWRARSSAEQSDGEGRGVREIIGSAQARLPSQARREQRRGTQHQQGVHVAMRHSAEHLAGDRVGMLESHLRHISLIFGLCRLQQSCHSPQAMQLSLRGEGHLRFRLVAN